MRIAAIQLGYGDAEPLDARVERVAGLVRGQAGADLVVLPELWPQGGFAYRRWAEQAEPLDGPTVGAMRKVAEEIGVHLHMGSIIEADAGRLYNTSVLIGPDGELVATYRKIHLFGFGDGEPVLLSEGEERLAVVDAGGTMIGLATCYDLRFPELFRRLVDAGAELVLLPAAWPARRVAHWSLLARARAVEDQLVVVAVNTAGTHAGHEMGGRSVIVDPWGEVLAEAGTDEQVLTAEVDLGLVARTREAFPVLRDRRF